MKVSMCRTGVEEFIALFTIQADDMDEYEGKCETTGICYNCNR